MQREELKQKFLVTDDFQFNEGNFCGKKSYLIQPKDMGVDWSLTTPLNRSRIVSEEGEVLSQSFPKFWNYGESPELYPCPLKFDDWEVTLKIDGSTCIVDYINDQISMRTRGIFNYTTQQNAKDFEQLFILYPKAKDLVKKHSQYSFIWEIVTPSNRIVINYDKVDFYFIGCIDKKTGILFSEKQLDVFAEEAELLRPKKYLFESIEKLAKEIEGWEDAEGVVKTYNGGQSKVKLKAKRYLFLHKIMSGIRSKKDIVENFINLQCPSESEMIEYYTKTYDFEIATEIQPEINKICDDYEKLKVKFKEVEQFVKSINLESFNRREMAAQIMHRFTDWRKSYAFAILDNKNLDSGTLKKLLLAA